MQKEPLFNLSAIDGSIYKKIKATETCRVGLIIITRIFLIFWILSINLFLIKWCWWSEIEVILRWMKQFCKVNQSNTAKDERIAVRIDSKILEWMNFSGILVFLEVVWRHKKERIVISISNIMVDCVSIF